jgi:hypothetical protein
MRSGDGALTFVAARGHTRLRRRIGTEQITKFDRHGDRLTCSALDPVRAA